MITVLWLQGESKGYVDELPDDWFLTEGSLSGRIHFVRGPRGGLYKAKCNVRLTGSHAEFDYEPFPDFNTERDMSLGVMRIEFEGTDRVRPKKLLWKSKGRKNFRPYLARFGYERPQKIPQHQDVDLLDSRPEGRKRLVTHLKTERSPELVAKKKKAVLKETGALACEACNFKYKDKYGQLGATYCEVHHRKSFREAGRRKTRLIHLAILCSNCHRMIHRTDPMLSVEKFRETYLTSGEAAV